MLNNPQVALKVLKKASQRLQGAEEKVVVERDKITRLNEELEWANKTVGLKDFNADQKGGRSPAQRGDSGTMNQEL